jgi:hypothetical protein
MNEYRKVHSAQVIGALGEPVTGRSLPPRGTTHWVIRRKAEVLAAINGGLLSIEQACERYDLSLDELILWQRAVERSGMHGLRVTRIQHYKSLYARLDKR